MAPGMISGEVRSALITFLGLFSASILPTISLLINSMTASGRSIKAIDLLEAELQSAMDALLFIFGLVIIVVICLIFISVLQPLIHGEPFSPTSIALRLFQSLLSLSAFLILFRAGQLPGILRRCLSVRHDIARSEARRKLDENAPSADALKRSFSTKAEFGNVVPLSDSANREGS